MAYPELSDSNSEAQSLATAITVRARHDPQSIQEVAAVTETTEADTSQSATTDEKAKAPIKTPVDAGTSERAGSVKGLITDDPYFTDDRQVCVQVFKSVYDTTGVGKLAGAVTKVLARLGSMFPLPVIAHDDVKFSKTKKQAPLFNVANYAPETPEGANRAEGTYQVSYWAVVGDADAMSQHELDAFEKKLRQLGVRYLKTTSFKHTPDAPRCRYVIPLAHDITHSEYVLAWAGLNALAGGKLDPGAKDPTRRSYFPSCPKGTQENRPPPEITGSRLATLADFPVPAYDDDSEPTLGVTRTIRKGINAEVLAYDGPPSAPADYDLIRVNCRAVAWAAAPENQPKVEEPYWRGLLGIVKFCSGADELAHQVSEHHPKYDPAETVRMLDRWNTGPTTCNYF